MANHYRDSEEVKKAVGASLKAMRSAKGFTRKQVADEFVVTENTVYRHETGRSTPDVEDLAAYSSLYDVPVSDFFSPSGSDIEQAKKLIDGEENE